MSQRGLGPVSLEEEPEWSVPGMRDPRYSRSLERGLAILGVFTPERCVLGISEIAQELGMSRSTTHRYMTTLVALGYVGQVAARKYRLGLRVTDLGMVALKSTGLREHVHPYLQELRQRTSCTASLGVLEGGDVLYVERVRGFRRGQRMSGLDLHAGSRLLVYCTAIGELLLANRPEAKQRGLLAAGRLMKRASNAITSKRALREEFEKIKLAGFGCSDQEFAVGVLAVIQVARVTKRMRSWQRIRADGMASTVTAQDEN